jgi:uncharacterized protein
MIIKLSELYGGEAHYIIENDGWFPHEEIGLTSPVNGMITINRVTETEVVATGEFSARVEAPCDRCGQSAELLLSGEFTYDCIVGKEESLTQQEVESGENDVNKLYLEEPIIDAGELFREQILLAMPVRILCKQSCRGLCFSCGTDLNSESCGCGDIEITSPFSVLKKMKGR